MLPGHLIGQYVLLEQIGVGGQAVVWSASDERLKRIVAIKTIKTQTAVPINVASNISTEVDVNARFEAEARIIADLEHPAILPIYNFGQEDQVLYIIMRYMAGGSLKKLL